MWDICSLISTVQGNSYPIDRDNELNVVWKSPQDDPTLDSMSLLYVNGQVHGTMWIQSDAPS